MTSPVVSNAVYVILGASGNTGSVVANFLLSNGERVRAVGRNAGRLRRFVVKGAEAFTADSDAVALTKAFSGARAANLLLPPVKTREAQERESDAIAKAVKESSLRYAAHLNCGAQVPAGTGPVVRRSNMHMRTSMHFAAGLLAMLASFVAITNAAPAAAPQHHDQVPGFYRLKVGDLEVTALLDGSAIADPHWLHGEKTVDGLLKALQTDPHIMDGSGTGYVVNTGKQLILVDAGAGTWYGGGVFGHLAANLRSAGYTPEEVDIVLITHLHVDHIGGLTTQDGQIVFPNAEVYVAKPENDFWLSPEIAAKAPKDVQPFFQAAQGVAVPYIKAGKWHTFSDSQHIVDGMQIVPLHGHAPGHTGYEFSSQGKKILFWGDIIHVQRVQLQHPEVTVVLDGDPSAAAATRNQLLPKLASEGILIAGPHMLFPGLGRLHKEGTGYSWAPVAFTDKWEDK